MAELFYGYQPWTDERISFIFDPSRGDTYFRHSECKNYGEECFGDKQVSHLVMRGTVNPDITEGELPWPMDWNTSYQESMYQYTKMCSTGVNSCTSTYGMTGKPDRYGCYFWTVTQEVWQIFSKDDGIYCRAYTRYLHDHSDVDVVDAGGILDPDPGSITEFKVLDWDGNLYRWPVYFGPWTSTVSYELHDPTPYLWKEWMSQIRPWTTGDSTALSEVIRNTIQRATSLETNNYANILQIVDLFRDFRNFKFTELIKGSQSFYRRVSNLVGGGSKGLRNTLIDRYGKKYMRKFVYDCSKKGAKWVADGWLKYRYAYNTTKSDVEEYIQKVVKQKMFTSATREGLTSAKVLRGSIPISFGEMRVKMRLHDNPFAGFDRCLINADRRGLLPGLYNTWDMVPFSFVADWFSGLGDIFQDIDQSLYFRYYKVDELLVTTKQSLSRNELWGLTDYKWYSRELLPEFPNWEIYEESGASGRTVTYRAMDLGSLIVGVL